MLLVVVVFVFLWLALATWLGSAGSATEAEAAAACYHLEFERGGLPWMRQGEEAKAQGFGWRW